jgi:hypothetical protein
VWLPFQKQIFFFFSSSSRIKVRCKLVETRCGNGQRPQTCLVSFRLAKIFFFSFFFFFFFFFFFCFFFCFCASEQGIGESFCVYIIHSARFSPEKIVSLSRSPSHFKMTVTNETNKTQQNLERPKQSKYNITTQHEKSQHHNAQTSKR